METYHRINELNEVLFTGSDELIVNYSHCWNKSFDIVKAITSDLNSISGANCFVASINFILEDSSYRQGASGCVMEIKFVDDFNFLINAECLINHNRVLIKVKQRPDKHEYEKFISLIESKYNAEFCTELKELMK